VFDEQPKARHMRQVLVPRMSCGTLVRPEEAACFLAKLRPEEWRYIEHGGESLVRMAGSLRAKITRVKKATNIDAQVRGIGCVSDVKGELTQPVMSLSSLRGHKANRDSARPSATFAETSQPSLGAHRPESPSSTLTVLQSGELVRKWPCGVGKAFPVAA
jgi:hypothetical protein